MPAFLDDAALVHHEDAVRLLHGGEAMGDDQRRPAFMTLQRTLNQGLVLGIERARRLVEQQDRRVLEDGAGDGEPLALAARE